jgi:hypothetical protein
VAAVVEAIELPLTAVAAVVVLVACAAQLRQLAVAAV